MPIGPINQLGDPRFRGSGLADAMDACAAADVRAATFLYQISHSGELPEQPLVAPQLVSGTIDLQISDGSIVPVREYSPLWNQATIYTYVGAPEKLRGYFDELRLLVNAVSGSIDNTYRLPQTSGATSTTTTTGHITPVFHSTEQRDVYAEKQWTGGMVLSVNGVSGVPIDSVSFSGGVGPTLYNWRALPELIGAFSGISPIFVSGSRYQGDYGLYPLSMLGVRAFNDFVMWDPDGEVCERRADYTQQLGLASWQPVYAHNPGASGTLTLSMAMAIQPGSAASFVFPNSGSAPVAQFSEDVKLGVLVFDAVTSELLVNATIDQYSVIVATNLGNSLATIGAYAASPLALSGVSYIGIGSGQYLQILVSPSLSRLLLANYYEKGYGSALLDNVSWSACNVSYQFSLSAMSGSQPVVFAANWVGDPYDDSNVSITEY